MEPDWEHDPSNRELGAWKATSSSTLPSSVLEALPLLNRSRGQRPFPSPFVSLILNPFRQSYGSELSSGRGVLISPAGPLFVQRQVVIPVAVRRVCIEVDEYWEGGQVGVSGWEYATGSSSNTAGEGDRLILRCFEGFHSTRVP